VDAQATDLRDQLQRALGDAYTVESELGGGGMARVFVAAERRFARRVVIKVLAPELAAGVSADRFEREVMLAAQLQQANIVPVFNAGDAAGLPFYTMPLIDGESLRARLATAGRLPVAEATAILSDVCKALAYAHARGIVHRDIKPENILLSGGTAVVTDFGIAKAIAASRTLAPFETLTQVGTSLGTPAYMAPEQAMGDPATDHRADLYALGVTAYEMLAGQRPFTATSSHALVRAHVSETPAPIASKRDGLPPELAAIVMQCLAKDPADRPETAEAVLRALERGAEARAVISPVVSPRPDVPVAHDATTNGADTPAARTNRVGLTLAAVAGAALIAVIAFAALRQRPVSSEASAVTLDASAVLVAPTDAGGDTTLRQLASTLVDAVTRGVATLPPARLVEDASPPAAPNDDGGRTTDAVATSRGRASGAGTVVATLLARAGSDSVRVQFRVVDASTGRPIRVLAAVRLPRATSDADVARVLEPLLSTLGIIATPGLGGETLPAEPPRFAAVREMMTSFIVARRTDSASRAALVEHLGLASAADTTYLQARLWKAAVLLNFYPRAYFETTRSVADSVVRDFAARRDRLTAFENALYDYVTAFNRGDQGAILRTLRSMSELAPASFFVVVLPTTLLDLNRPREALAVLEAEKPTFNAVGKLLAPKDNPRWWNQVADIQHYLHDYRAELDAAQHAYALDRDNIMRIRTVLRANAGLGDTVAIEQLLTRASTMSPRPNSYEFLGDIELQTGQEIRAHGHHEYGIALVRRSVAWFESRPPDELTWRVRFRWAIALHDLGDPSSAARVLAPLLQENPMNVLYVGLAGRIAAAHGDTAEARRISAKLAGMGNRLGGSNTLERAFIASVAGKRDDAVALLRDSFAEGQGFFIRWRLHWLTDTRPLVGYPPFDRLLVPEG
jgi:hypothetical protein